MDKEVQYDKLLHIRTNGRDDSKSNFINYPYEATPYCVLERLVYSGYIKKKDKIIDFGCGKGRVDFYLSYMTKSIMIGVEYDERLYNSALNNKENALSNNRTIFYLKDASSFEIDNDIVGAYFFNPFSIKILEKVILNIKLSLINNPREFKLFFYFPSKDYLNYISLNNIDIIEKIDCSDLFEENKEREYILVCKL